MTHDPLRDGMRWAENALREWQCIFEHRSGFRHLRTGRLWVHIRGEAKNYRDLTADGRILASESLSQWILLAQYRPCFGKPPARNQIDAEVGGSLGGPQRTFARTCLA